MEDGSKSLFVKMESTIKKSMHNLKLSAERSLLALFSSWIKAGRSLNLQDEDGWTPLHTYTCSGDVETVKYLLENGANPNIKDNLDRTPLHYASKHYQKGLLSLFMGRGLSLDVKDKTGRSPLHYACIGGLVENVQLFLENNATAEIGDNEEQTPLHYAALSGHLDVVHLFITRGFKIDLQDAEGQTALHLACGSDRFEVVEYLLRNGANPTLRNYLDQATPLHEAARLSSSALVNLLLTQGWSNEVDIDAEDSERWTPLLGAICVGKIQNVQLLLDNGAFIDSKVSYECVYKKLNEKTQVHQLTPLHCGSAFSLESLNYLLNKGALVGVRNSEGETAYDMLRYTVDNYSETWAERAELVIEALNDFGEHILKFKLLQPVDEIVDDATKLEEEETNSCQAEVSRIKSTEVGEGFALYEVVSQRDRPEYLFNAELKTELEALLNSPDFLDQFPNYGMILRSQLVRSKRSRWFSTRQALTHIFSESRKNCLKKLPQLVWTKIFALISDHDLYNFTQCVSGE